MATRKAYAISEDGTVALMFPSKALRDWFIAELPPKRYNAFGHDFKVGTCDQYRKVERAEKRESLLWRNYGYLADVWHAALNMELGEYWNDHNDMHNAAFHMGLI